MSEIINIICVLWKGDFLKRTYTIDDVIRLHQMVQKHLTYRPIKFYCLTNVPLSEFNNYTEIIPIALKYNLSGWWSKLELFRLDLPFEGKCIYFDLDTIITGSIDDFVNYSNNISFCTVLPLKGKMKIYDDIQIPGETHIILDDGLMNVIRFRSAVISWIAGTYILDIPDLIKKNITKIYRGDQDFFADDCTLPVDIFPKEWFIKIRDCYLNGPEPEIKIVWGNPKKMYREALRRNFPWVRKALGNV